MLLPDFECKEFISNVGHASAYHCLWRGWGDSVYNNVTKIGLIVNRVPKHNSFLVHNFANIWFLRNFGIQYRSDALFCTGNRVVAKNYGNVYSVLPCDGYRFCWSRKIKDLYAEVSLNFIDDEDQASLLELLNSGEYSDQNINMAIQSGCELMINAPSFYVLGKSGMK